MSIRSTQKRLHVRVPDKLLQDEFAREFQLRHRMLLPGLSLAPHVTLDHYETPDKRILPALGDWSTPHDMLLKESKRNRLELEILKQSWVVIDCKEAKVTQEITFDTDFACVSRSRGRLPGHTLPELADRLLPHNTPGQGFDPRNKNIYR